MQHITVLVSNDLQHDQRVAKVCNTLLSMGYKITLVGRLLSGSTPFARPYEVKRFKLAFSKGALFYAALNVRLFFYLLLKNTDAILANDLDTLLPAYLVSKFRGKRIYYDSHEYFTEAEGLTGRGFQKRFWLMIERFVFPKLKNVYTVNASIAEIYSKKYNVPVQVVRNIPPLQADITYKSREELHLPVDRKIILLQGAFIDPDRGGVELVQAMQQLEDVLLLIIGSGRDIQKIRELCRTLNLQDRVRVMDKMPADQLRHYTANADLGLSLDKPLHLNYTLSLPNKLFDYIHAGTPVLVSDLPELRKVVQTYQVGWLVNDISPTAIAEALRSALNSADYELKKTNCMIARLELNWQKEEHILQEMYRLT